MTDSEKRKAFYDRVLTTAKPVREQLAQEKKNLVDSSRSTMQNLAIIIGTFAGGSFVLLASSVPSISWLLMLGIAVLIFEVFWIFKYLFERVEAETDTVSKLKKDTLDPLDTIITLYRKAVGGEINWEKYDKDIAPLSEGLLEQSRQGHDVNETDRSYYVDNTPRVCVWLSGLGLLLIGLSLLLPYLVGSRNNSSHDHGYRQEEIHRHFRYGR